MEELRKSTGLCHGVATNTVGAISIQTIPNVPTKAQGDLSTAAANLTIGTSTNQTKTESITQTAFGVPSNSVINDGLGSISIPYGVTQNANEMQGNINNTVEIDSSGGMQIGLGGVTVNNTVYGLNGSFGSSNASAIDMCAIQPKASSNLNIAGSVTIKTTNLTGAVYHLSNEILDSGKGKLSMQGLTISNNGPLLVSDFVDTYGANESIAIGILGVTVNDSAAVTYSFNDIDTASGQSPISILGSVTVTDLGSGSSYFNVETGTYGASSITVHGNVSYDDHLNQAFASNVMIGVGMQTLEILGTLTLKLANTNGIANKQGQFASNMVLIGNQDAVSNYLMGGMTLTGGNGPDRVLILGTFFSGDVNINLKGNPSANIESPPDFDQLTIDGSTFLSATITMSGPRATLNINDDTTLQTSFWGFLTANLTGLDPVVKMSAGTGSNFPKVEFIGGADFIGSLNSGGVLKYHAANIIGPISTKHFQVVTV